MLSNLLYILLAVVIIGVIIAFHEFGHYLVGRLCGIGIVEYSIGFGPKLLGWERSGIQYSLRAVPLGGYCAFVGEDERNDDPRAMHNQPVWKRFLTVLAGPAMNFVLAFIVCVILLCGFYRAESLPVIDEVFADMPAQAAGMLPGDVIVEAEGAAITKDGEGVARLVDVIRAVEPGSLVHITVDRDGERIEIPLQTVAVVSEDTGATHGQIGIAFAGRNFTLPEALRTAVPYMGEIMGTMLNSLRGLFFHGEGITQMTGTVGIIAVMSKLSREGLGEILWLVLIISLNLGIINLLPLPALDGGRLVFLIVEAIRRKPVPPDKEGLVHGIGLVLVFGLFIALTAYDIYRLVTGGVQNLM